MRRLTYRLEHAPGRDTDEQVELRVGRALVDRAYRSVRLDANRLVQASTHSLITHLYRIYGSETGGRHEVFEEAAG